MAMFVNNHEEYMVLFQYLLEKYMIKMNRILADVYFQKKQNLKFPLDGYMIKDLGYIATQFRSLIMKI